jgi:hypothetical protein
MEVLMTEHDRALEKAREWFEYEPCNEQNLADLILSERWEAKVEALEEIKKKVDSQIAAARINKLAHDLPRPTC